MIDLPILLAIAGLLSGALIAWLWRAAEVAEARGQREATLDGLRDLEVAQAGLIAEREALLGRLETLTAQVRSLQSERDRLLASHAALQARQHAESAKHREQLALLTENREQLRSEFENLAHRIFEERGRQLNSHNQQSIEALLKPFAEQIRGFQTRVNEVHAQSLRGNESLALELRNLMSVGLKMSDQAENLATALKGDKKITGNWGEVQLERTLQLAGLERGLHYETQTVFRDEAGRRRLPDFLIKLPDGKHLIIDSKVSLVDYERAIGTQDEEERESALRAHSLALKRHIGDLAAKDYAALPGVDSPELVFMFMPIEAAYIEALKYDRELFNEGFKRNVIMVSHTTLLPMLRTVAGLWMSYRSNEEAKIMGRMAGDIYNKVRLLAERLEDMGRTLSTATLKYNRTVTALVGNQGLLGKVERFRTTTAEAGGDVRKPDTLQLLPEHDRLRSLAEDASSQASRAHCKESSS